MRAMQTMAFALSLVGVSTLGCGHETCDLDAQTTSAGIQDCGTASPDDTAAVTACAKRALQGGIAFRARYDARGIDSRPSVVYVRDTKGLFMMFVWDDGPSGGGESGAKLEQWSCAELVAELDPMGKPTLSCRGPGRQAVVCEGGEVRD